LVLAQSLPKFKAVLKKLVLEEESRTTACKILKATLKRSLRKMLSICYPNAGLGHEMNFSPSSTQSPLRLRRPSSPFSLNSSSITY